MIKKVISSEKIPIKMWLDNMEEGALEQATYLANLPFAFRHIAIMPDSHQGYGMPIGGVMATKKVIVPNAVGVDIGCGMCAVKTSLTEIDTETLKKIIGEIRKVIPVGFKKHQEMQNEDLMPKMEYTEGDIVCDDIYNNALKSLGTLGGGNHFIEIQKGDDEHIWIMIHSGSRNLGLKVAQHYNQLAYDLNIKWYSNTYLPKNPKDSLAFLPVNSEEGQSYIREMNYCIEFALANRKLIMDRVLRIFDDTYPIEYEGIEYENPERISDFSYEPMINIAHNYASQENHFGQNVWVHRKGATLARKGTIGIIPGSQGTSSYIVEGLGNRESFESCSHGAGRKLGRKKAIRELNLEEEIKKLDDQNIIHGIRNKDDLEEAMSCYKDINIVMENQKDLVKKLIELKPLAVIKG